MKKKNGIIIEPTRDEVVPVDDKVYNLINNKKIMIVDGNDGGRLRLYVYFDLKLGTYSSDMRESDLYIIDVMKRLLKYGEVKT